MHVKGVTKIGRDPVGSGGFADVWKGMVNGKVVALKVPRLHCEGVDLKIVEAVSKGSHYIRSYLIHSSEQQTWKEGFIWSRLSHENILPLLGFYSTGNDPIIMVSPWMDNGNLTTYLKHNQSANRQELVSPSTLLPYSLSLLSNFLTSGLYDPRCMVSIRGFATYTIENH